MFHLHAAQFAVLQLEVGKHINHSVGLTYSRIDILIIPTTMVHGHVCTEFHSENFVWGESQYHYVATYEYRILL